MARRGTTPDGSKAERRKSNRFPVAVPIEARWRNSDGVPILEQGIAKQVNANGGFLEMARYPEVGSRVTVTNFLSAQTSEARVLATPNSREGVSHGIIIELISPNDAFWGVNLQVKKASVELQKLEKSLQSEGIDFRLLSEFHDSIDAIRTTALAVQQLRELKLKGRDAAEILSMLVTERVRRAANVCRELVADLDAGILSSQTHGVEELFESLEDACDRMRHLLKSRQPDRYATSRT